MKDNLVRMEVVALEALLSALLTVMARKDRREAETVLNVARTILEGIEQPEIREAALKRLDGIADPAIKVGMESPEPGI